jgi:hypothetical protein
MPFLGKIGRPLCTLLLAGLASVGLAHASATLLLEEPYGKLGFFTATGHAAVYLSGVCAQTPLVLRPCAPGELGVVISRYDGVSGYDWVAVPLIPYLYAVDRPEDIPLFVDPKTIAFLREQYRRKHLESVAPDLPNGAEPSGNWYELVGTAYDRTTYGFEIETSAERDLDFIREYNSRPNVSHFRTVSRNCADFAKDVINFYYPRALHRSIVADVGIATPKQMAKTLIKFSSRHSELQFSRFVIPQVPGSAARSTTVHGVVESFLKSKKYIVPSAIVSPIFAGCVVAVYMGTGAGRFDPAQHAWVYSATRDLEPPIGPEDRRSYQLQLSHLAAAPALESTAPHTEKWGHLLHNASPDLDAEGRPVLRIRVAGETVRVGIAADNILTSDAPEPLTQELLQARLHSELRRGNPPKASESDVTRDWNMLQKAMNRDDSPVASQSHRPQPPGFAPHATHGGNQP